MAAFTVLNQPGSLPIIRTRLIGREAEIALGRAFLLDDAVPLLTVTGPGGVGKTRLALAIAEHVAAAFSDGVVWVDLAPLADPTLIPATVAAALGFVSVPDRSLVEELAHFLRPRQTLLLLDNCEHVLSGAADLAATLLAACPAVQMLATSRATLRLRGEQLLPLDPLPLPPGGDAPLSDLEGNPAVRLFLARGRAARPAFALTAANAPAVAHICRDRWTRSPAASARCSA